jgi:hypothetical protein
MHGPTCIFWANLKPFSLQSAQAAACPRLRPRQRQRLGGGPRPLGFTEVSAEHYKVSEGGALLRCTKAADGRVAYAGRVMTSGRHAAEFTVVHSCANDLDSSYIQPALARPGLSDQTRPWQTDLYWGVGQEFVNFQEQTGQKHVAHGMNGFGAGDVVGLLLDCDAGTLTVKKNGAHRKVAVTGAANPRGSGGPTGTLGTPLRTPWFLSRQGKRHRKRARASAKFRAFGSTVRPTAAH